MAVSTRGIVALAIALVSSACSPSVTSTDQTSPVEASTSTSAGSIDEPTQSLEPDSCGQFVNDIGWELLRRSPQTVTDLGLDALTGTPMNRLDDLSYEYRDETVVLAGRALERLGSFDPADLSPDQQVTEVVLRWYLEDIIAMHGFADHEYAVSYITGAHADFPEWMADVQPVETLQDAQEYIARLDMADDQMQQRIEQHRPQIEAWEAFCDELGEAPAAVALAWLLHQPVVTAPIIGPRMMEQLTDAPLRALEIKLSEDQLNRIDDIWPGYRPAPEHYAW